jgi:membrane protease YdiL (CAAX protease family)
MNAHKFTRKDWNMLAICGLLLLISVFYLGRNYRKAFPSYDIDFKLSRAESRLEAEKFLSRQNIDLNGFRHAVIFDYDELTKIFMEKEVGLEEASRLVNQDFPIWRWSNRWFKPLSREEFKVSLTTDGRIASFEHILPEEAAADAITIEAARKICRNFLFSDRQLNPEEWEFIEDKTDRKPNRVDYLFTYKKKGIEIFNATYRIDVGIQGDQIGKYHEYWKLPEQWLRGYQRMRSLNSTTALSANIFFLLILIAALITFSIHLSRKNVHFKTALWFGLATFILQFISQLNELPIQIYAFDTNQSLGNYYGDYFIQTFIVALLYGLLITVIAGAGESLYRRAYPDHIALPKAFTGAGIRTKSFLTNSICGFTLAVVFIAFQTCFYLIANHFGAWAPAEVTYSDVLNTYIPWIYVLLIGFTPAVTEEFSFRLFAIPFIGKITHSKLLAVLIPAIVWGFAHANYPNQPFWIRGAEVSLFGVFIGMIFMRFGILTVLVWHYTIDAIYTATFLVKTGQPYLVITASLAAGLIGLPILYNLVSYLRTRKFSETNSLVNDATGLTPEPTTIETEVKPTPPEIADYQSHPSGKVRNGLILSAVFLMVLLLPANKIGEFYHFPIAK